MANGIIITNKITNKTKSNMVTLFIYKENEAFYEVFTSSGYKIWILKESFVLFVNSFIIIVLVLFAIKAVWIKK